jgi:hypothetical protein
MYKLTDLHDSPAIFTSPVVLGDIRVLSIIKEYPTLARIAASTPEMFWFRPELFWY